MLSTINEKHHCRFLAQFGSFCNKEVSKVNRSEKDNRPLTEEESVFIEKLITENRKTIKNIIHNVLGEEYRQLAEDTIYEVYLLM